jgi:hypothetical protein
LWKNKKCFEYEGVRGFASYLTVVFSAVQIKENVMDRACGTYGQKRYSNMKPEDKRQLGRP